MRTTTVVILAATLTFCVFIFCARMRSLGCVRMRSGGCRPGLCAHEPGTVSLYHHPLGPRCLSTVLCNVHGISLRLPLWRAFLSMLFWVWLNHRVHARTEEVWSSTPYAECFIYFCIINERVFFFFFIIWNFTLYYSVPGIQNYNCWLLSSPYPEALLSLSILILDFCTWFFSYIWKTRIFLSLFPSLLPSSPRLFPASSFLLLFFGNRVSNSGRL